jgi:hypothetical protein
LLESRHLSPASNTLIAAENNVLKNPSILSDKKVYMLEEMPTSGSGSGSRVVIELLKNIFLESPRGG